MAIREKMRERCQPLLPPGEQIRHTIYAQVGPSPWFSFLSWIITLFSHFRIIAVTQTSIVIFSASRWSASPKEILAVLPRQTLLGPVQGLWGQMHLNGERIWVHKRFHKDIEAADAEIGAFGGPLPQQGWPPQPQPQQGWPPQPQHQPQPQPQYVPPVAPGAPANATPAETTPSTPPNWYPDPHGQARLRWWDGTRWTEQVAQ